MNKKTLKLGHKVVEEMAIGWLKKQGWKLGNVEFTLLNNKLEEFFYKPHALVQKDKYKFWVNVFDKSTYVPLKRDEYGNVMIWGTGFEYYKYMGLKELEAKTGIPAAVVFYNEEDKEFVFRPLRELPKPIEWHKPTKTPVNCVKCNRIKGLSKWLKVRPCIHQRMKFQNNKSMWDIEQFVENTKFQIALI